MKFLSKFKHFLKRKCIWYVVCKMSAILSQPQCVNDSAWVIILGSVVSSFTFKRVRNMIFWFFFVLSIFPSIHTTGIVPPMKYAQCEWFVVFWFYAYSSCLLSMMTSSNGNIFRLTGHLCGELPAQRPVTQSFDVLFDLNLNKRLSKQSWGWWFEMLSRPLWRHCNAWLALELSLPPCLPI